MHNFNHRKSTAAFKAFLVGLSMVPAFAFADDPTTVIGTTLATYLTDVGTLAAAVLTIYYGKKLVSYLKV